jgi:hypothetical protein
MRTVAHLNRWTVLTVVMGALMVATVVNLAWHFNPVSVVGFVLWALASFWVVSGCADRGDPVARHVLRRPVR